MLRESRHLQVISLVIAFGAIGAYLIEQQLNMAAEAFKGRTAVDSLTAFLGTVQLYTSIAGFLIQVLATSRIHRLLGIGFALLILPVSLGHQRRHHAGQRGALGAVAGARVRHVAALHGRQDDPRDPVPAAARPAEAPGQAVRRRHRGPHRQGHGRPARAGADRAVGPQPRLAARQLRQPGRLRAVDLHGDQGQAGLHQRLPPGPRPRRRRARNAAPADGRRLDDRDAGRRAGRSRRGARPLRHRRARVARQAQPDHAAAALPRVAEGPGAGADGAVGGAARSGREMALGRPADARRRERRGAGGGGRRPGHARRRGADRSGAPVSRRRQPAHRGDGGGRCSPAAARTRIASSPSGR